MAQLVTRVDDALAAEVDDLVAAGVAASRSDAVRMALMDLVERQRRVEVGRRIVDGYRRIPQDDPHDDEEWDDESTLEMIRQEPW